MITILGFYFHQKCDKILFMENTPSIPTNKYKEHDEYDKQDKRKEQKFSFGIKAKSVEFCPKSRLILAGILGLPLLITVFSMLGVHDFMVGRKKEGALHVILSVLGFLGAGFILAPIACDAGCTERQSGVAVIFMLFGIVTALSAAFGLIWSLVESIQLLLIGTSHD